MESIYVADAICSAFFLWIFGIKRKSDRQLSYAGGTIAFSYLLMRIFPILMQTEGRAGSIVLLAVDMCIFFFFEKHIKNRWGDKAASEAGMLYSFQPCVILCITSGKLLYMVGVVAVLLLVLIFVQELIGKKRDIFCFYPEYILLNISIFVVFSATQLLGQTIGDCLNTDAEEPPMCLILGLCLLAATVYLGMKKWRCAAKEDEKEDIKAENGADKGSLFLENAERKEEQFGKTDIVLMTVLTVITLAVTLWKVGSHNVPENAYQFIKEQNTQSVILDFGEDVTISKIEIFLGETGKGKFSFSYPSGGEWKVFDSQHEITSVFAWNEVAVNGTIRYLGIVSLEEKICVLEMVVLDENGNMILPVNAEEYSALFDEQQLYVPNASYYDESMFDEVYHGRTAYEFLHGLPIYENTHPPLGKIILSFGIAIFGMNPFGWRFMNVLCGTFMIPFAYLFGFKMTKQRRYAILSAVLMMTGFMHFTLSRIATIDITVACFVLAEFYFMYCYVTEEKQSSLLKCGICMGIAMAVKWTGIYAACGSAVVFFFWLVETVRERREEKGFFLYLVKLFGKCVFCFLLIPACIYVLSYIPFARVYTDKNILQHAIANGQLMLNYHANTVFEHPYSSEWYEWMIDKVPLLDARTVYADDRASVVATLLNPLICFGGLAALCANVYLWRCRKDKTSRILLTFYLAMLLPWLLIHRTVFIYQYFCSALVLIFMIVYSISRMRVGQKKLTIAIGGCSVLLFVMFYPALSGQIVLVDYIQLVLNWFPRWNFV